MIDALKKLKVYTYAKSLLEIKGGEGSGNFGHAGRPGEVGGSGDGGSVPEKSEAIIKISKQLDERGVDTKWQRGEDTKTGRVVITEDGKFWKVTGYPDQYGVSISAVGYINMDYTVGVTGDGTPHKLELNKFYLSASERAIGMMLKGKNPRQ